MASRCIGFIKGNTSHVGTYLVPGADMVNHGNRPNSQRAGGPRVGDGAAKGAALASPLAGGRAHVKSARPNWKVLTGELRPRLTYLHAPLPVMGAGNGTHVLQRATQRIPKGAQVLDNYQPGVGAHRQLPPSQAPLAHGPPHLCGTCLPCCQLCIHSPTHPRTSSGASSPPCGPPPLLQVIHRPDQSLFSYGFTTESSPPLLCSVDLPDFDPRDPFRETPLTDTDYGGGWGVVLVGG